MSEDRLKEQFSQEDYEIHKYIYSHEDGCYVKKYLKGEKAVVEEKWYIGDLSPFYKEYYQYLGIKHETY